MTLFLTFLILLANPLLDDSEPRSRRLGLLVGVGSYQAPTNQTLKAPPNDVDAMTGILTAPNGYGFRSQDLIILKNEDATLANFRKAFEDHLIRNSRPGDVVLLYFSGHGSQVCDQNGDEQNDGKDETLLFHDADDKGGFLVDDELEKLLLRVPAKHLVVILDACHSGTASRGERTGAKWIQTASCDHQSNGEHKRENTMITPDKDQPGLVVLSAVTDDSFSAFERGNNSNFTAWLIEVLAPPRPFGLTYEQLAYRVKHKMDSYNQTPSFKGNLHQTVFDNHKRVRPIAWMVTSVDRKRVVAKGIPMPGWSKGGVVDLYAKGAESGDFATQENIKASMVIDLAIENKVRLKPEEGPVDADIEVGDFAVLRRVGEDLSKLGVNLRSPGKKGGIPKARAIKIANAVQGDPWLRGLVGLGEGGDFELALAPDRETLQLLGPEGSVRNQIDAGQGELDHLGWVLWLHALQRHLLQLAPATENDKRGLNPTVIQEKIGASIGNSQIHWDQDGNCHLPVGTRYRISVSHQAEEGERPLQVGGLVLSGDGSTYGFPLRGNYPILYPGQSHVFQRRFKAVTPLDLNDHVLVFGTSEENPVYWHLFQNRASGITNRRGEPEYQYLLEYLMGNRRSGRLAKNGNDPWLLSRLTLRVFE